MPLYKNFSQERINNTERNTTLPRHAEMEMLAWLADSATMQQLDMFVR
jgi:hypothetical protein